jgi:prephenate dehydrogenase
MVVNRVSIIGLGLIGGSISRALNERMGIKNIIAIDKNPKDLDIALKDGYITEAFTQLNNQVFESDIIFICTPVKFTMEYIKLLAGNVKPGCIITDVASTKGEIVNYVNSLENPPCFVGGHPMAGTEKSGFEAGFVHLFENAYYILTPTKSSTDSAINLLSEIVKGIGAIPIKLDADEHDIITATISHVPHVIAFALVNLVKTSDSHDGKMQLLAAGGFKDITRIASSSPQMWESVVLSNKEKIITIINKLIESLNKINEYIDSNNSQNIYSFFESAKNFRDSFSNSKRGLINPLFELIVDVIDKPGIIGEIATLLGRNEINIKNINVSNSREFEQGCLRITLPDSDSVSAAYTLLSNSGYRVFKI